ncbi:MAG: hypothetical protein M3356_05600, partial [Actinomycetota bacterium]|nr:hypothetical protein [Actinomycetota bacterium]
MQLAASLLALGLLVVLGPSGASAQDPVLKDNGKIAFVSARSGDPEVYTMNPDGTEIVRLTENEGLDFWPDWSPDGTKIVYTSFRSSPDGPPNLDIFTMNADGTDKTRITEHPAGDLDPAFFPDGRTIVFVREVPDPADPFGPPLSQEIRTLDTVDGTERMLAQGTEPAVSPDGTKIAFERGIEGAASHESGNHEIFIINADGSGGETKLTDTPDRREQHPNFSPDGTRIVFDDNFHNPEASGFIYSMKLDGSDVTQLTNRTDKHGLPSYSPDGTKITFTAGQDFLSMDIWTMDADGSNQRRITTDEAFDIQSNWQPIARATQEPQPQPQPPVVNPCGNPAAGGYLHPAKIRVSRARVLREDRRLDVLAPITARAEGDVRVMFHADDRKDTFAANVTEANTELDEIRILEPITRGQAELGTGIVNLTYLGDEDTRPEFVRLRAASQRAELEVDEISLLGDRLSARGSVTDRAEGVVRFRFSYVDPDGSPQVHIARATIQGNGDWRLNNDQVPTQLAQCGGYLSIQFTGYFPRRIRGEQL